MKQLEVQIMGQSYLLACPEGGEQRLLEAVEKVDTAMCKIRDAGKVKARDRIAVLAALNLAFDVSDRNPRLSRLPVLRLPSYRRTATATALTRCVRPPAGGRAQAPGPAPWATTAA